MDITDRFVVEHQVFLRQLTILEEAMLGPADSLAGRLGAIVETLHGPLEAHADAEEGILFPELEARMGGDSGVLTVMVAEHRTIQSTVAEIETCRDAARARRLAEDLIDVLREHIAKEDDLLFPAARDLLGSARLVELDQRYASVPATVLSAI